MIVVAGEALVDLVQTIDGSVTAQLGGGPFNVARTIGRLGGSVTFLGAISNDRFGQRLHQRLIDDGVQAVAITRTDSATTLASAELDTNGAATYRFYIDGTSAPSLDRVPSGLDAPTAVHLGTLGLVLEPVATTLLRYLDTVSASTLVMLDPNCRPAVIDDRVAYLARLQHALDRADVVKISTDDAAFLSPQHGAVQTARAMVDAGVRVVLVTAGADATTIVSAHDETVVPAVAVQVADTIGAGDSFGGGFLAWWVAQGLGRDQLSDHAAVVEGVAAAHVVAALTCAQVGAEPPRRAQLPDDWDAPRGRSWTST